MSENAPRDIPRHCAECGRSIKDPFTFCSTECSLVDTRRKQAAAAEIAGVQRQRAEEARAASEARRAARDAADVRTPREKHLAELSEAVRDAVFELMNELNLVTLEVAAERRYDYYLTDDDKHEYWERDNIRVKFEDAAWIGGGTSGVHEETTEYPVV